MATYDGDLIALGDLSSGTAGRWIFISGGAIDLTAGDSVVLFTGGGPMKTQYQSREELVIYVPAFISTTGAVNNAGTDNVSIVVVKPDATSETVTPTWDATAKFWSYTFAVGSYQKGAWKCYATTDAPNCLPWPAVLQWGDYVDDITTARKVLTGRWRIDTTANQLVMYDDDGTTVLYTFSLLDKDGNPTSTAIFERARV